MAGDSCGIYEVAKWAYRWYRVHPMLDSQLVAHRQVIMISRLAGLDLETGTPAGCGFLLLVYNANMAKYVETAPLVWSYGEPVVLLVTKTRITQVALYCAYYFRS